MLSGLPADMSYEIDQPFTFIFDESRNSNFPSK